jgi:hypothetical protein
LCSLLTGVRAWILERIEAEPDLTIDELRDELRERGVNPASMRSHPSVSNSLTNYHFLTSGIGPITRYKILKACLGAVSLLRTFYSDTFSMAGRQAKILSTDNCGDLLVFASTTQHPLRDRLIVLLSIKAGLRAAEIANLTWEMVLTPTAEIGATIELHDG